MQNGGAIGDFLDPINVEQDNLVPVKWMNESIKPGVVAALKELNRHLKPKDLAPVREHIISLSQKMTLPSSKEVDVFGPTLRADMYEHFKPIHKWLSETSGREQFFTDIEAMLECKPISEEEAKRQFLDQLSAKAIKKIESEPARDLLTKLKAGKAL